LAVTAGTGLRFGEISALWVGDVDLDRGTVRVNKAWKRNGEDDATETPGWLSRQLRAKHTMRDHHLGHPKTPRSRRTITIAPAVAALLKKRIDGRPADDFVFTSRTGLPLHNGDFYTHVWSGDAGEEESDEDPAAGDGSSCSSCVRGRAPTCVLMSSEPAFSRMHHGINRSSSQSGDTHGIPHNSPRRRVAFHARSSVTVVAQWV
jgi:hypothetical protein